MKHNTTLNWIFVVALAVATAACSGNSNNGTGTAAAADASGKCTQEFQKDAAELTQLLEKIGAGNPADAARAAKAKAEAFGTKYKGAKCTSVDPQGKTETVDVDVEIKKLIGGLDEIISRGNFPSYPGPVEGGDELTQLGT